MLTSNDGTTLLDGYVNTSNILCVSKARLKDQIATLTITDIKAVDKAIASSLDLLHHYAKLENNLNDKLQYIERLKTQRNTAQDELKELLNYSDCKDIDELKKFLKNTRQN